MLNMREAYLAVGQLNLRTRMVALEQRSIVKDTVKVGAAIGAAIAAFWSGSHGVFKP